MFGRKSSRGALLVNLVLGGHAAYRTQLFCYLKACGRDELNTMNLWAGADGPRLGRVPLRQRESVDAVDAAGRMQLRRFAQQHAIQEPVAGHHGDVLFAVDRVRDGAH